VVDAQFARASPQSDESRFGASKKIKGRKRNLVADTMELLIAVTVTAGNQVFQSINMGGQSSIRNR